MNLMRKIYVSLPFHTDIFMGSKRREIWVGYQNSVVMFLRIYVYILVSTLLAERDDSTEV